MALTLNASPTSFLSLHTLFASSTFRFCSPISPFCPLYARPHLFCATSFALPHLFVSRRVSRATALTITVCSPTLAFSFCAIIHASFLCHTFALFRISDVFVCIIVFTLPVPRCACFRSHVVFNACSTTYVFRFWLSFLKHLSNNPVHDLPICSGELGRQKAQFCCLGCKVARFPVLDKGVMHQKIRALAGVLSCNVLDVGNKCAGNTTNPPCAWPSTSGKGSQYRFGHCSGLCHFSTITCAPMLFSHW